MYQQVSKLFASLKPASKALLYVLEHVENRRTRSSFYSIGKLAKLAGISRRSTFYALRELEEKGLISRLARLDGLSKEVLTFTVQSIAPVECNPLHPPSATGCTDNNSLSLSERGILTTTAYNDFCKQYGKQKVDVVVDIVLNKMNGRIRNKGGYIRKCLELGVIPTDRFLQAQEVAQRKRERIEAEIERNRARIAELEREAEQTNPQTVSACLAEIQKLLK